MNKLTKSMVIDGIAASQAIDSSGEILDIEGLDISSVKEGTAQINYEHRSDSSDGASANDIIGHITYAKKIFGPKDCENDRQLKYWNSVQLPFVYIKAELFDGEGHVGAQAAAALIRYYHLRRLPLVARYSIEGSTLKREGNTLKRSIMKRVSLTVKPCNRSCISGVLSDGEKPEASPDALESLKRFENPGRAKLGGYEGEFEPVVLDPLQKMRDAVESLREMNNLNKALSAGGFDAVPTTLTGGAALSAENFGDVEKRKKFIKNQVLGAVRDWRGRGDLRKFLKHRMPDASEDFINHFAALVEDYQLKKFADLEANLNKAVAGGAVAGKTPAAAIQPADKLAPKKPDSKVQTKAKAQKLATVEQHHAKVKATQENEDNLTEADLGDQPLTVRGKAVRANDNITSPHFDERTGTLHTQRGSFKMYLPQEDKFPGALESFHNALNDPKATHFHDYATSNWLKVHKLLKEGRLPPEVIMHSVLFSQLSPNTPVPMQELMYGHLVDTMKEKGVDARSPSFSSIKDDWIGRDTGKKFPEVAGDFFQQNQGIRLKNPTSTREAGDMGSFMLANNKFKNMEQYHGLHNSLVELFGRHSTDARAAVSELMGHKHKANLWEARRAREIEKGRPDPGEYADGPAVPGLAPKTGRYMAAMIGGGNVHVPDTHFARYLFGLEKGTDKRSIAYLKNTLWNPNNSHVLEGIDRFYATNHPAVQHMMDHPVFGKQFASREDAIFPAFWKNWIAIAPHERARKMKTMAYNEATDHKPFWEAIAPFTKAENDDVSFDFGANADTHAHARKVVNRLREPNRSVGHAFVDYVVGKSPKRPDIHPDLERHLARHGIVDPAGYGFDESGRSMRRPIPGPRKIGRGEEPRDLHRFRMMNRGWDPGYVKGELEKSESGNTLPQQTARLHAQWVEQYGEIPAQMLYYAHIVPQLLRASRRNENVIVKFQRIAEDLRKAVPQDPPLPELPKHDTTGLHEFQNSWTKPGEIELTAGPFKGSKLAYLGKDSLKGKHFAKAPTGELHTLPFSQEGKAFKINVPPQPVKLPAYVDANQHSDPLNKTFAQKSLLHGIDINDRVGRIETETLTSSAPGAGWYKNHAGEMGLVKPDPKGAADWWADEDPEYVRAQKSYDLPSREALYPVMAKEFFGMGQYVPTTAKFTHPKTGEPMSVQQRVAGAEHVDIDDDDHAYNLHKLYSQGELDKLGLMDILMGNNDRHQGNFMMTSKEPHVHLIDNGLSLDYKNPLIPHEVWLSHQWMTDHMHGHPSFGAHPIHAAATNWLLGLDHGEFVKQLLNHGVPENIVKHASRRMQALQLEAAQSKLDPAQPFTRARAGHVVDNLNGFVNRWGSPFVAAKPKATNSDSE